MNSSPNAACEVISFYSYKGGVGRSMAVANVGRLLANQVSQAGRRVLLIDWDLEAPGLAQYFPRYVADSASGLINFFAGNYPDCLREYSPDSVGPSKLEDSIVQTTDGVDVFPAGRQDATYPGLVSSFNWRELVRLHPEALTEFRLELSKKYAYILIDSRTGVSDISGISTGILPDKLVTLFAPNQQNLAGLRRVVPQILSFRRTSSDERPLTIFPVPSRFDAMDLNRHQSYMIDFRDLFCELFKEQYGLESVDLEEHFNETLLPYVPTYSYGERIVVMREEPDYPGSLRAAYTRLANRLQRHVPWRDADELA